MFTFVRPTESRVTSLLTSLTGMPPSFRQIFATRDQRQPTGYFVDHNRIQLGFGEHIFHNAVRALHDWKMFNIPWLQLLPRKAPVAVNTQVAVAPAHLGFHSINPCRIIYVIDDDANGMQRSGFGYATLPGHLARGEERFLLTYARNSGAVHYEVLAYSQPAHALTWLGLPFARLMQRRFAKASLHAMHNAANSPTLT
jgi:uncharacterized protein (UPF0548 family)